MNAISAIAIACGQDWRAIESGLTVLLHMRIYGLLIHWESDDYR